MATARLGIIGGSGLYAMPGLIETEQVEITTPFGAPSDTLTVGLLEGAPIAFLPRHGRGHRLSPGEVPSRANIYALKSLGVERIISVSAVGSLREDIAPLDLVIPDWSAPSRSAGAWRPVAGRPRSRGRSPSGSSPAAIARPSGPSPKTMVVICCPPGGGPAGRRFASSIRVRIKRAAVTDVSAALGASVPGGPFRSCALHAVRAPGPSLPAGPPELLLRLVREVVPAHRAQCAA